MLNNLPGCLGSVQHLERWWMIEVSPAQNTSGTDSGDQVKAAPPLRLCM